MDKPSSSLPSRITFSEDLLHASVGFRRIDTIKSHIQDLYQPTIKLDNLPPDAVLDSGDVSTLPKANRNTTPVPRPLQFADIMHMDIVFGPEVSIGNIHYGLMFTDRFSCMTYIFPLQTLLAISRSKWMHFSLTLVSYLNVSFPTLIPSSLVGRRGNT